MTHKKILRKPRAHFQFNVSSDDTACLKISILPPKISKTANKKNPAFRLQPLSSAQRCTIFPGTRDRQNYQLCFVSAKCYRTIRALSLTCRWLLKKNKKYSPLPTNCNRSLFFTITKKKTISIFFNHNSRGLTELTISSLICGTTELQLFIQSQQSITMNTRPGRSRARF